MAARAHLALAPSPLACECGAPKTRRAKRCRDCYEQLLADRRRLRRHVLAITGTGPFPVAVTLTRAQMSHYYPRLYHRRCQLLYTFQESRW